MFATSLLASSDYSLTRSAVVLLPMQRALQGMVHARVGQIVTNNVSARFLAVATRL